LGQQCGLLRARIGGLTQDPQLAWITEVEDAARNMREIAASHLDEGFSAVDLIKQVVGIRPALLNYEIVSRTKNLPIQKLIDAFTSVVGSLVRSGPTDTFNEGPAALTRLWQALQNRVNEHDRWQDIENTVSNLEDLIASASEYDQRTFLARWLLAWRKTGAMCDADLDAQWSRDMKDRGKGVQTAIAAKDWQEIDRAYAAFRLGMSDRFSFVDKSLLDQCQEILELGNPLSLLLKD
jgi:hypothetical protein